MPADNKKNNIGVYKESSLHNNLKCRYAGKGGKHEVAVDSYVCDAVRENGEIIEIQTGSFAPLKEKVLDLALYNKVRIVHPIIKSKTIELYDEENQLIRKRKSPRKGSAWDLFKVLLYAPELAAAKNIIIELLPIDLTEIRKDDSKGSWRRKGVSVIDKIVSASYESIELKTKKDYQRFVPFLKDEKFTSSDFAKKTGIAPALASKTLYTLTKTGFVLRLEKKGRSWVYATHS
jgi:ribosomal protein S25